MIKKSKLVLTDRAISDLLQIEEYSICKWGKKVTVKYLTKFEKTFKLIELNPDILLPNPQIHGDLLFYRVEKHLLACVRYKNFIAILTIAHANRDLVFILHELLPNLKEEVKILLDKTK